MKSLLSLLALSLSLSAHAAGTPANASRYQLALDCDVTKALSTQTNGANARLQVYADTKTLGAVFAEFSIKAKGVRMASVLPLNAYDLTTGGFLYSIDSQPMKSEDLFEIDPVHPIAAGTSGEVTLKMTKAYQEFFFNADDDGNRFSLDGLKITCKAFK